MVDDHWPRSRHSARPARSSAWISVDQRLTWVPGCSVGDPLATGGLARFPVVARGCPVVQSTHSSPGASLGVGPGGATLARTAGLSLVVGLFESRDVAGTYERECRVGRGVARPDRRHVPEPRRGPEPAGNNGRASRKSGDCGTRGKDGGLDRRDNKEEEEGGAPTESARRLDWQVRVRQRKRSEKEPAKVLKLPIAAARRTGDPSPEP
jgi:hypothetical protein